MSRVEMLMVFSYDVRRDRDRRRVAKVLEAHSVRVQKSVFESWMSKERAEKVARKASLELGPGDSLRVYAIDSDGYRRTRVFGSAVLSEPGDYYLV